MEKFGTNEGNRNHVLGNTKVYKKQLSELRVPSSWQKFNTDTRIRDEKDCECIVLEKTVGQYTELNDGKDVEIYDGDIIENINGTLFQVEWNDDKRLFQTSDGVPLNENANYGTYKLVMGNIHNNPLMLNQ